MQRDDMVYIRHILDAASKALLFTKNHNRKELDANEMLSLSLVRLLEIIGEAANVVSADFREKHSQIPWKKMIGLRNRLIHGYFDVNLDIVWDTVEEDLPPLVADLEKIIPPEEAT
ncbi:MAG: hypothetical protein COW04_10945 [Deltaproteobacteria bacterium CG12_big_fil_rev_8_21_14_0_65_43_10]|nr:MAG: hypothetical protein AUK23_11785 [Deltaproteobacteria bacterium CG2_30_43_15]PIQ44808.1 MAG: hypothetical protein COW04_10945 [Deltaproteobacteria bacterium CG12_big_fil_rev_8_21_14_0_65_43_10]PIU85151.1 MAG: hypothetical protein COS67_09375 [Deltaproteobacteria bacterium CG06_land_8_20_14_3_00_44_19]PIX22230.1 MAG: hypothetical protein COZ68_12765 [Deltaproteobacteria bacterium CG_4_8_14_3_um_filter_43_13]PIZ19742.1 MAG: hypothetical protein COY50_08415 [Deltaproteobacteria bacterium C